MSAPVSQERFFYGGQAVLEGVLMRGRTTYAVAVRRPDGEIQVLRERLRSVAVNGVRRLRRDDDLGACPLGHGDVAFGRRELLLRGTAQKLG